MKKSLLVLTAFLAFIAMGFSSPNAYKFHSIFIYNFTRYIQWPVEYQAGDFVIAVVGNSAITPHLQEMAKKKSVRNQHFKIVNVNQASELPKCHMVFVPKEESHQLQAISSRVDEHATLIITEKTGMCQKGSGINFTLVEGKWKFEVNKAALEEARLKVSSELLRFAILV